eukprot:4695766-Amphidinium_carterae.1
MHPALLATSQLCPLCEDWLELRDLDTSSWGKGNTKTVASLVWSRDQKIPSPSLWSVSCKDQSTSCVRVAMVGICLHAHEQVHRLRRVLYLWFGKYFAFTCAGFKQQPRHL